MKTATVRQRPRLSSADRNFVIAVMIPAVLLFLAFTFIPVVLSFIISFTRWELMGAPAFIGLRNYLELYNDQVFRTSMINTILFTLMYVPPMIVISLGLALLVNRETRGAKFFRTVYFLPVVTSFVVFALIFEWIFRGGANSLSNSILAWFGIPSQAWLQDPDQALPLLALLGILKGCAWNMVYFLAGLKGIPDVFYEAAAIDGAGRWKTFRNVTLPLLRPTMYFVVVLTTIGAFQVFDSAYLLTQGGPANATTTIVYFIYQMGFENFRMGYASASAYALLLLVLLVSWVQNKYLGKDSDWY
jgi:multiple sugar transport system permease protein